ncbi:hypothetical protein NW762_010382 [Fusarium torreyae]|uniref:DUF7907 domain-containing protein n=1 Tax=Fusarium torreyae TaxID=1237075 RepID=A0A9W8VB16_9HYPO|nr:hypothetical protein NW762_010382 [Fusarium torreyae]
MKTTFVLSALLSSALAAPFQLVVSQASAQSAELKGRAIVFQSNTLFVADSDSHGVNFNSAHGTLSIQNGDPVYVDSNGQVKIREYQKQVPSDGLTTGFTDSGNNLKWAQGDWYACKTEEKFSYGDSAIAWGLFGERSGAKLPKECSKVTLKKAAI